MLGFRPEVLIIILVIVLLIFGARRLPEIGRSLGQGITSFRKGMNELNEPEEKEQKAVPASKPEALESEVTSKKAPTTAQEVVPSEVEDH